jgi:hypothetical protein
MKNVISMIKRIYRNTPFEGFHIYTFSLNMERMNLQGVCVYKLILNNEKINKLKQRKKWSLRPHIANLSVVTSDPQSFVRFLCLMPKMNNL